LDALIGTDRKWEVSTDAIDKNRLLVRPAASRSRMVQDHDAFL